MEAIASRLEAIAIRLEAIASRLEAIASRLEAIASRFEAIASRLEAIASRFEAIASRFEAIAIRYCFQVANPFFDSPFFVPARRRKTSCRGDAAVTRTERLRELRQELSQVAQQVGAPWR